MAGFVKVYFTEYLAKLIPKAIDAVCWGGHISLRHMARSNMLNILLVKLNGSDYAHQLDSSILMGRSDHPDEIFSLMNILDTFVSKFTIYC